MRLKQRIREELSRYLLTEAHYGCAYNVSNGPAAGTCNTTWCGPDPDGNNPVMRCDCDCDNHHETTCCPSAHIGPGEGGTVDTKHVLGSNGKTTTSIAHIRR
jgi:hypothetical protein